MEGVEHSWEEGAWDGLRVPGLHQYHQGQVILHLV